MLIGLFNNVERTDVMIRWFKDVEQKDLFIEGVIC